MRFLRSLMKVGAWASLVIFVVLSAVFLTVWTAPGLLINTAMLKRVTPHLPASLALRWRQIDLSAKSLSFFRKRIRLRGQDICWHYEGQGLDNCFGSADVTAEIDIKGWFPKYRLGPVALLDGKLRLQPPPSRPEEKKKKEEQKSGGGIIPSPPAFLKSVVLDSVTVELKRLAYVTPQMRLEGTATLSGRGESQQSRWDLSANADVINGKDTYRGNADIHLQSLHSQWFGPYVGTGAVKGRLPGGKQAGLDFRATPLNADEVAYRLSAVYRERKRAAVIEANGKGGTLGVSGALSGRATGLVEHLARVSLQKCPFSFRKANADAMVADASVDCAILVGTSFPNQRSIYSTYLKTLSLRFKANARLPIGESNEEAKGRLELLMDPLLERVKEGRGSLATDFHGRFDDFPKHLDVNTHLLLEVPKFQKLVRMLDGFPWAVPDPFHTLDGDVRFEVTSKGRLGDEVLLPIQLTTRLQSKEQSFVIDGNGQLKVTDLGGKQTRSHLDFRLQLSDLKLELPYLSLGAPPRFTPDPRIKVPSREKPAKPARQLAAKQPSSFTYDIQIATADKPVRLISNLAKSEIPLTVDLRMSDRKPISGSVRVASFNVELFRRNATVQHFYVRVTPDPDNMEVNGEVQVVYTDYTVKILVLGLAKAPEIKFVSEPPLPEKDVIAVLLFGKKIDALDTDQTQSVGSTRSAVADSAVSLASMYLLASTPVESVGYDPGTGVFNAKVRLADGTSLTVGSNFNNANQVGLRRRITGNLYLDTTYSISDQTQEAKRKLQTLLEWSKAY